MGEEERGSQEFSSGVIPYVFFDLIARVAPGLVLLFGIDFITENRAIKCLQGRVFPTEKLQESATAWLLVLLSAGYVAGHLISPIVKFLDKSDPETSQKYNDIRVKSPGITPIPMRIRAEYIMYGGFAIALATVLIIFFTLKIFGIEEWAPPANSHPELIGWAMFFGVLLLIVAMIYRNQKTIDTYQDTVKQLHVALGLSGGSKKETTESSDASRNSASHSNGNDRARRELEPGKKASE